MIIYPVRIIMTQERQYNYCRGICEGKTWCALNQRLNQCHLPNNIVSLNLFTYIWKFWVVRQVWTISGNCLSVNVRGIVAVRSRAGAM